ncbi:MAG: hypothetical protein GVY02_00945 [Bacteroidetes bacterium]|jgi:hypothetical protein|nr:hypothetical protein [Bacteroidota bacterium]
MSTLQRRLLLFLLIQILFSGWLMAQSAGPDLTAINRDRISLNSNGMLVLGGWAVSNMIIGGIGMAKTSGTTRYFHQMNAAWNSVNLAIAGFGYYGLKNQSAALSLSETVAEFQSFEKIFNAGLDVGYMALGAFLWERGLRKESDRLTGYGQSLILQGGFLFTFDLVLYFMNRSQSSQLLEILERVQFTGTSVAVNIPF